MATVVERLLSSDDVIDREVAIALRKWQDEKAARGQARRLGRVPAQLNRIDSTAVIASTVNSEASGFEEVSPEYSFETITVRHRTEIHLI